jgi:hypothetical protein
VFESFRKATATFPRTRHTSALNACSMRRSCQAYSWSSTRTASCASLHVARRSACVLIDAFIRKGPTVRGALANAILVVDAPQTLSLLTEARERARSTEDVAALKTLTTHLTRNPACMRSR